MEEKLDKSVSEHFLFRKGNGTWSISALGALLFARNLKQFPSLAMKAIRVILYEGNGRLDAVNDVVFNEGYALSFKKATDRIADFLKKGETIGGSLRTDIRSFPLTAVREMLANALIHQDLGMRGSGPMLEIFATRVECSNPGKLLVPKYRVIDAPPKTRNEALAAFFRRLGMVEERGSGFDRIEEAMGEASLPSPLIETADDFTRVRLMRHDSFSEWRSDEKLWTVYMTTCLKYTDSGLLTNRDLRKRLGVKDNNSAIVSRLIKEAIMKGLIKLHDENVGYKGRQYIPYLA